MPEPVSSVPESSLPVLSCPFWRLVPVSSGSRLLSSFATTAEFSPGQEKSPFCTNCVTIGFGLFSGAATGALPPVFCVNAVKVQVVVQQLLLPQSQARLGASDVSDLYISAWFMDVNFNKLYERDVSGLPKRSQSAWVPEVELGNPMKYYGRCANRLTVVGGANSRFDPSKTMDKIMFGDSDVAELLDDSTCDSERRWFHEF